VLMGVEGSPAVEDARTKISPAQRSVAINEVMLCLPIPLISVLLPVCKHFTNGKLKLNPAPKTQ
jgi:hypothetical protein